MASNGYVQFDPAVIEQARQIDLLSYLQRYEPSNLKRVASNVYCKPYHAEQGERQKHIHLH